MTTLNVVAGAPWPAGPLPNLANMLHTLEFDGKKMVVLCAEGPIQAVKFPLNDPRRYQVLAMGGVAAKKMSRVAKNCCGRQWIWWDGKAIAYGSTEHHTILAGFIRAKFAKGSGNEMARSALLATVGCELIHNLGHPEGKGTSLPAAVFVKILTEIRAELVAEGF